MQENLKDVSCPLCGSRVSEDERLGKIQLKCCDDFGNCGIILEADKAVGYLTLIYRWKNLPKNPDAAMYTPATKNISSLSTT